MMDAALRSMLNESEQELLRATQPRELKRLDEDELVLLHDRVRRARTKYSKLYRRRAGEQVSADRSRKRAHAAHERAARKAEGFEDALARVSQRLAVVAAASAADLKAQRLSAARRAPVKASSTPAAGRATSTGRATKQTSRTPASEKRRASTKAANQRKQVARDRRS